MLSGFGTRFCYVHPNLTMNSSRSVDKPGLLAASLLQSPGCSHCRCATMPKSQFPFLPEDLGYAWGMPYVWGCCQLVYPHDITGQGRNDSAFSSRYLNEHTGLMDTFSHSASRQGVVYNL